MPGGGTTLSTPDLTRLTDNLKGYDISPEMTKLAMANMYLHTQNKAPNISNYDTLTSTDHWNEYADVMLANPPFMTPKGGIEPHSRFRVPARRAEVLFVDYIASHLNEHGRAGIIVPEGIIFQSQNAYRQLRRFLLDESLVAVISLPGGVFNPYSGVKTSILILDKALAPKTDHVAFFKVESDGYDLGAQRRPISQDDLPAVADEVDEYLRRLRSGETLDEYKPMQGRVVAKCEVAADGEYNLSGERYSRTTGTSTIHPMVKLGTPGLFEVVSGGTPKSDVPEYWDGGISWITLVDLPPEDLITEITETVRTITEAGLTHSAAKVIPPNSVVVSSRATIGRVGVNRIPLATNQGFKNIVIADTSRAMAEYVALAVTALVPEMQAKASGATYKEITKTKFADLEIPLPPLEVQREIVAEIEGYQRVLDGARAVVDNWRPRIAIDPEWPLVELGDICKGIITGPFGSALHQSDYVTDGVPVINPQNITGGTINTDHVKMVSEATRDRLMNFAVQEDDIVIGRRGEMGRCGIVASEMSGWLCGTGSFVIRLKDDCLATYVSYQLSSPMVKQYLEDQSVGVTMKNLNQKVLSSVQIPLPPLATQQAIVAEIEAEQALVSANRELAQRMEARIAAAVGRVWNIG